MQTISHCRKGQRCGQWRTCDYCSRYRQKTIADNAVKLMHRYGLVTWYRVTPQIAEHHTFKKIRAGLKDRLNGRPAIWTIEQGQLSGKLHVNIITPDHNLKPFKDAENWKSEPTARIREIAAYITKRSQYPNLEAYSGRIYGAMKGITEVLLSKKMNAIITAATIEHLSPPALVIPTDAERRQIEKEVMAMKEPDYREIAMRHLPNIAKVLQANKPPKKLE